MLQALSFIGKWIVLPIVAVFAIYIYIYVLCSMIFKLYFEERTKAELEYMKMTLQFMKKQGQGGSKVPDMLFTIMPERGNEH